jgi:hypothetical protein
MHIPVQAHAAQALVQKRVSRPAEPSACSSCAHCRESRRSATRACTPLAPLMPGHRPPRIGLCHTQQSFTISICHRQHLSPSAFVTVSICHRQQAPAMFSRVVACVGVLPYAQPASALSSASRGKRVGVCVVMGMAVGRVVMGMVARRVVMGIVIRCAK